MCTFLQFCRHLSAYSVAMLSNQRCSESLSCPCLFTTHMACYGGYSLWSMDCVFIIHCSISSLKMCVNIFFYVLKCFIVWLFLNPYYPVCFLCVIAFTYIITAHHFVETSWSVSEGTQNPQHKTGRNTAKIVVGLTFVFLISYVPYHAFWTYIICTAEQEISSERNFRYSSWFELQISVHVSNFNMFPFNQFLSQSCTSSPFRQHLKRYLTCFAKQIPPYSSQNCKKNLNL